MCGDQLQSFGVASRKYGAALLYQQAATIAFQLATDGRLLGADSRVDVANGDYYVLHTVAGDYVLGRATKTILLRAPQPSPGAPACPGAKSTPLIDRVNAPYLTLVPAAASLWRSEIRRDQVWLWPLATRVATTFDLVTASGAPVVVATIRCTSAGAEASCTISRGSTRDR
jgi:hypothetical protein